jgi:hypothetical protein
VAAIGERRHYTQWGTEQWLIWQTRTICTFVAATVPVESEGDDSALLTAARNIGMPDDTTTGPDEPAERPQPAQTAPEPPVGSYESFMSSMANPSRWAGR